jgi:hypothetical protein
MILFWAEIAMSPEIQVAWKRQIKKWLCLTISYGRYFWLTIFKFSMLFAHVALHYYKPSRLFFF